MTDQVDYIRRRLLGRSALLGSGLLAGVLKRPETADGSTGAILPNGRADEPYSLNDPEQTV